MHNMGYYHPQSPIWVIDQSKSIYSTIWVFDHPQTQSINRKIWVIDHSHSQSINSTIWVIVHDQSPIWVIDYPQSQSINCGRCKFPRFCNHERYLVWGLSCFRVNPKDRNEKRSAPCWYGLSTLSVSVKKRKGFSNVVLLLALKVSFQISWLHRLVD